VGGQLLPPGMMGVGGSTEPQGAGWMVDLHVRAAEPRSETPVRRPRSRGKAAEPRSDNLPQVASSVE
jgi:hypothetical protein